MALDNHTATIRVGDQQPVQVSSSKSTNNDVLTQSIEYKNTGVLLSVTPRVNSGGLVTMELRSVASTTPPGSAVSCSATSTVPLPCRMGVPLSLAA